MLTFEYEKSEETLHIHADPAELRRFAASLVQLAADVEKSGPDHIHLHTPQWGGSELSEEKQSATATLVNHVKVHGWASS